MILQIVLTIAVAHNLLHCDHRVVEDPVRVIVSKATVLPVGDVGRAAVKIMNQGDTHEIDCHCNVRVLDLEVTTLLAAKNRHMFAASGAIARGLFDCFNSRQEMLVRTVPFVRVFGASVQMISVKRLPLA